MNRLGPIYAFIACILAAALLTGLEASAQTAPEPVQVPDERVTGRPLVLVANVQGAIGPATTRYIEQAIEAAEKADAAALILRINTPGGLVVSMREIIAAILAAPVPVIGYVAPPGAQAASAGTYIMYATHVIAMAPGTNMGAATPIQVGGLPGIPPQPIPEEDKRKDDEKDAEKEKGKPRSTPRNPAEAKAVNDAVAFIRSLGELRKRNVEWAEKAVREAASVSAEEALQLKIIEIHAPDLDDLLEKLNGRVIDLNGREVRLNTANAVVQYVEPTTLTRILTVLTNPNIAFILMLVGIYGLIFELASPGTFGPGVIGVICLVLGLYSLNQLPIDYAGLILIIIGVAFLVAEAFTPTFGILGLGGLASFIIGAALLIDSDVPAFQISWDVILGAAAVSGGLLIFGLGYAWRAARRPPASGVQRLVGLEAKVLDWSGKEGHVWVAGERWRARSEEELTRGDTVRVKRMQGLTLSVTRA